MDIKLLKNRSFTLWIVISLFTVIAHYFLLVQSNPQSDLNKIENIVQEQLSRSEKLIPANIDFTSELNHLVSTYQETNPYSALKINVFEEGEMIYWNRPSFIDTSHFDEGLMLYDEGTTFTTIRQIDLFNDQGFIKEDIRLKSKCDYLFSKSSEDNATHSFEINGSNIHFAARHSVKATWKSYLSFLLLSSSIFAFLIFHSNFSARYLDSSKSATGLMVGLLLLLIGRLVLNIIPFNNYYLNELVFSNGFNISSLHRSIAGNFWNGIFLMAGAIQIAKFRFEKNIEAVQKWILSIALYSIPIALLIFFTFLIRSLVYDSHLLINTKQVLSFDMYGMFEIISLELILISIFIIHHKITQVAFLYNLKWKSRLVIFLVACAISFPLITNLEIGRYAIIFYISLFVFYIIHDLFVDSKSKNLPWVIWWGLLYSSFLAALLFSFSFQKRIQERAQFVKEIYTMDSQSDNVKASTFHDKVLQSGIINSISTLPYPAKFEKSDIKDFLRSELKENSIVEQDPNFDIFIFDGLGNTYFSNDFRRENAIVNHIQLSKQVSPDVFYNPFSKNYTSKYFIENKDYPGKKLRIYIQFTTRKDNRSAIDPTNYVVFQNSKPLKFNDDNAEVNDALAFANFKKGNYFIDGQSIIIDEINPNIKLVSIEKVANLIKPISLFSLFFLMFGFLLLIISFLNSSYPFMPKSLDLHVRKGNSLKSRLQIVVVLLIIIAFVFIGLVSFYYFQNILEENQQKAYVQEVQKVQNNITSKSRDALDNDGAITILSNSIQELADVHNINISVFNNKAQLMSTVSDDKKPLLDFEVFAAFKNNLGINTINNFEQGINHSSFLALRRTSPIPYGFVEIEHKESTKISTRLKDFINTLLNLYVFLFLMAGAIAISVANSITYPLTALADKIKGIKLGRKNEKLEWNSKDEIGILINEYNDMLEKLEESASMLAKTERDHAWREMARQVSHEVKNPLTPMRLSVQYLDKAIKEDPDNAKELIGKVSKTLVEQIDALAEIANSFADLAKMPQAFNEKIVLNEVVETVHDLFRSRDDLEIKLIEPMNELLVHADKNHLIRILNNLIKNAIQAIPSDRRGKLELELSQSDGMAKIRVSDNGIGIPEEMKPKVFTPNFTTKSSGTGIGLAMCANMIESVNGKIYFNSVVDKGTDFYVEIPLLRNRQSKSDIIRVSLD